MQQFWILLKIKSQPSIIYKQYNNGYKKAKHICLDTIPTAKLTFRIGQDQL